MKKGYLGIVAMLVLFVGIMLPIATTLAQESAGAPVAEAQLEVADSVTFGALIKQGGWAMYPLGLFSLAMFYFIIRNVMLLKEKNMLREDLKPQFDALMAKRDVAGIRQLCAENDSLLTAVLDAGMERISEEHEYDSVHVMEAIEEAGNEQMVTFMKPINFLSIIGGTAPMLGLLGTVSGMIKAFALIAQGGMGDPSKLAGAIGEALITTATGLVIAIPAMIAYFIFKNNFIKSMSTMGRLVGHYLNIYRYGKTNG
ncbi:MotA/TolQ/ExbB proton channel family protein [Pontiella sulfatireligans]|uniref:Biopolymer transport protein ExbB n=1 Tax=Pontiella sulfatireligans TaxID=2750658 RepID=A0A6C2URE7_9BACT|nr:MotA/TolQ/ExbB proton channel family protein [Pontiella sulfatireligans]VGO22828.1 Biopolymer transport protein ExbB [Pontiella sulfatireligans]